ncbi:unnamed protein product [Nezara viridula]|uniref:N-acetyltransferase domain-containing protein n=1 Tax=Nezara viridula TaxID=85310 RepID=A0A9P0HQK9_NEZVI|nr:unnamed protein product [Nezara viridula]
MNGLIIFCRLSNNKLVIISELVMATIKFNIRKAVKEDCEEIFRLVKELAEYEKQPQAVKNDAKTLEQDGFLTQLPTFQCLVVDDPSHDGAKPKLIAYAMYCLIYCSKSGKRFDFRDIYISSKYRSHGVGKQLLSAVCKEAVKENVVKMNLIVLKWNPANSFYKKLGMVNITDTEGWQCHLMKRNDIERIANSERLEMSANKLNIRKATKNDCEEIFRLIKELAIHEKSPNAVKVNTEILERDGFESENPPFMCMVIDEPDSKEKNPKLLAYTLYSRSYSSYEGKRFVLGDIFISAPYRGQGLGKKLMSAVCKEAIKENVKTIRFNVLKTNPSIEFYKKLGIENITETEGWQYTSMKSEIIVKTAEIY